MIWFRTPSNINIEIQVTISNSTAPVDQPSLHMELNPPPLREVLSLVVKRYRYDLRPNSHLVLDSLWHLEIEACDQYFDHRYREFITISINRPSQLITCAG